MIVGQIIFISYNKVYCVQLHPYIPILNMTNHNFVLCSAAFIEAINSLVGAADNSLLWNKLGLIERSFIPVPVDHFRPLGKASSILYKLTKGGHSLNFACFPPLAPYYGANFKDFEKKKAWFERGSYWGPPG